MAKGAKEVERATAGFVLSLIGGILDAIIAILLIIAASLVEGFGHGWGMASSDILVWGAIGLIFAILVIVGAVLIYMPGKEVVGGILVIVFSVLGLFFTADGLFIGLILGIIGGALGIAKF